MVTRAAGDGPVGCSVLSVARLIRVIGGEMVRVVRGALEAEDGRKPFPYALTGPHKSTMGTTGLASGGGGEAGPPPQVPSWDHGLASCRARGHPAFIDQSLLDS